MFAAIWNRWTGACTSQSTSNHKVADPMIEAQLSASNAFDKPTHIQLGRHKARCVAVRLLMPPVENRTYHFHGIRLSTCGFSPCAHEAFLPISPAPQCIPRGQLARSLGTFVPVFPKARGLRLQSSSWCTWLSHVRTTTPHPPRPEALEFRWGLPSLLPTPLRILQEASRVVPVQLVKTGITPPLAILSREQVGEKGPLRRAGRLHERR